MSIKPTPRTVLSAALLLAGSSVFAAEETVNIDLSVNQFVDTLRIANNGDSTALARLPKLLGYKSDANMLVLCTKTLQQEGRGMPTDEAFWAAFRRMVNHVAKTRKMNGADLVDWLRAPREDLDFQDISALRGALEKAPVVASELRCVMNLDRFLLHWEDWQEKHKAQRVRQDGLAKLIDNNPAPRPEPIRPGSAAHRVSQQMKHCSCMKSLKTKICVDSRKA